MSMKKIKIPNPFKKLKRDKTKLPKQKTNAKQKAGFKVKFGISFKLYASFAAVLFFLLLVGIGSLYFINQMGENYTQLHDEQFKYVTDMLSLVHDFEQLNGAVASALLQSNPQASLEHIENLEANINTKIDSLKERYTDFGIDDDDIRSFDLVWSAYVSSLASIKDWANDSTEIGAGMAIGTYNTQLTIRTIALNKYLSEWVELNTQLADESYQQSLAIQRSLAVTQSTLIIIAVIVSIVLGTLISRSITRPLQLVTNAAEKMARGQLNQSIQIKRKDEIGQLASAFNHMAKNIAELIKQVKWTGEQVASSSNILATNMNQMNETAEQIAITINEVAEGATKEADHAGQILQRMEFTMEAIEQGLEVVDASLDKASKSTEVAYEGEKAINEAIEHLQVVTNTVSETTASIQKLGQLSENIGSIIHVITDISNQTNLLALNAAIEAARAGEHGKGFAVVADEVRKLAEESNQSAQQIIQLVNEIQGETANSIQSMENSNQAVQEQVQIIQKSGNALTEIIANVEDTERGTKQIQVNFTDIKQNIDHVLAAVQEISSIIEESAASAEQVASGAQEQSATAREISNNTAELAKMAHTLEQEVQKFQI